MPSIAMLSPQSPGVTLRLQLFQNLKIDSPDRLDNIIPFYRRLYKSSARREWDFEGGGLVKCPYYSHDVAILGA
jgi:hypothetical protein